MSVHHSVRGKNIVNKGGYGDLSVMKGVMEVISEEVLFELRWGEGKAGLEEALEGARRPKKHLVYLKSHRREGLLEPSGGGQGRAAQADSVGTGRF